MEDNDLFAIDISSDESATESTKTKAPRDFQSEADFLATLAAYKPNVQAGELHTKILLPIKNPSKPESQTILHAIEELYFFRRYREALDMTQKALAGELDTEFRKTLDDYRRRCKAKTEDKRIAAASNLPNKRKM